MIHSFKTIHKEEYASKKQIFDDAHSAYKKRLDKKNIEIPLHNTVLFEVPFARISYIPKDKTNKEAIKDGILALEWRGDITDEQYKEVMNKLLEFIYLYDVKDLLVDAMELGYVSMFARAWLMLDWIPRMQKQEIEFAKLAILRTDAPMHKVGIDYVVSYLQQTMPYECRFYVSKENAINWVFRK
ncbi:STAS/SEC14 domain-containing protein [Bernardetia sp. ABR2-2B]|uniref:STAS/SEC14 domain-containing protein n=1 Tax=Bernardetia sp. ABR2-2B TaxID=3127472 RepID=UPI0030CC874E